MRITQLGSKMTRIETQRLYGDGGGTTRDTNIISTFSRSAIKVNKRRAKDGYRKPSDYDAHVKAHHSRSGIPIGTSTFRFDGVRTRNGANPLRIFGTAPVAVGGQPSLISGMALDELRMKIRNNAADELVDVSMVLAEIGKTAETGANIMYRIGRSMEAVARRKRPHFDYLMHGIRPRVNGKPLRGRRLDKFNREVTGTYLEWKYGIMPSVYDLQGVTAAIDANEKGSLWSNPPLLVARATISQSDTRNFPVSDMKLGVGTISGNVVVKETKTAKARLDYEVSSELLRGTNRYGIGLTSLATVAWDTTPFAFVVDMVFPLAQLIKAWNGLAGVKPVGYCETRYTKWSILDAQGAITHSQQKPDIQMTLQSRDDSYFTMSRRAFGTVPMPLPFLRNPVKVGNIATVLSLYTQLRKRK